MPPPYSIYDLARIVGGSLRLPPHDAGAPVPELPFIGGVNDLLEAGPEEASWAGGPMYVRRIVESRAGVVLVAQEVAQAPMPVILCECLERSVALLLQAFAPPVPGPAPGIHPTAVIHPSASLGDQCCIGPHVVVQEGASLGTRCILHAGAYVGHGVVMGCDCVVWSHAVIRERCILGDRVIVHSCAVIGADGFGFYFENNRHQRVPHVGAVRIGDDVEVGACTCIDRSKFGHTVIGAGTKIDNMVQIAHNVQIGEHCVIAGQSGFAGSARTGPYGVFGGRIALFDGVTVGEGVQLGACTVATSDIPARTVAAGHPWRSMRDYLNEMAAVRRLPALLDEVRRLRARVEKLESSTHDRP